MTSREIAFLKAWFEKYQRTLSPSLLNGLPPDQAKSVLECQVLPLDAHFSLRYPQEVLERIHYTWLSLPIKDLDDGLRCLTMACLSAEQRTGLGRIIPEVRDLQPSVVIPTGIARAYCIHILYDRVVDREILPLSFIPESAFSLFLRYNKVQIIEIMDFLGLYDLAVEIRRIVDTQKLKLIYTCLTEKQQQFLRICFHQKDRFIVPSLKLDLWQGDRSELLRRLHIRGMFRLGKALAGENTHLIWYITHILDRGRGLKLQEYCALEGTPQLNLVLSAQVKNVINFLFQESA